MKKEYIKHKNNKGFLLLETVVAIAVLSIYSGIIITLYTNLNKLQRKIMSETTIINTVSNIYVEILANPNEYINEHFVKDNVSEKVIYLTDTFEIDESLEDNYIHILYEKERIVIKVYVQKKIFPLHTIKEIEVIW